MAIPTEKREAMYTALFESLRGGASLTAACKAAGISRSSVYADMKKDGTIRARIMEIEKACIAIVEDALFAKAAGGSLGAICFYLGNRAPERWKDIRKLQIEGQVAHGVVDLAALLKAVPPVETAGTALPDASVGAESAATATPSAPEALQCPIIPETPAKPLDGSSGGSEPTTKYAVGDTVTAIGAEAMSPTHGYGKALTVRAVHVDGDDVSYDVTSEGVTVRIAERKLAAAGDVEEILPGGRDE